LTEMVNNIINVKHILQVDKYNVKYGNLVWLGISYQQLTEVHDKTEVAAPS